MFKTAPFKHLHFRCDTISAVDSLVLIACSNSKSNSEVLVVACVFKFYLAPNSLPCMSYLYIM